MIALKKVLVATDFSEASQAAVEYACSVAGAFDASLHVLHVVTAPLHETWASYAPGADFMESVARLCSTARSRTEMMMRASSPQCPVVIATTWGDASEQILKYVESHTIDLVVCGTHGRRGFDHLVMGSVAERVVRLAACPVLTVHAPVGRVKAEVA
jgi:nucleotide-binding universal stress UspA family protein